MRPKTLLTAALLLFILASVVVLVTKEIRRSAAGDGQASLPAGTSVMVYSFHGKVGCPTCANIESYAHEAVESGFPEQLKSGRLVWRVVNYEEPGNEHFAADFELIAPSVVLVTMRDGKQVRWRGLGEVWDHVGDKPAFVQYVQREIQDYLAAPPARAQ